MNVALFAQSPTANKVADPVFSPPAGSYNTYPASTKTIGVSDTNMVSHIFYTKDGTNPTHSADSATGTTFRIGSHSGTINIPSSPAGITTDLAAIAYVNGLADSNIVSAEYFCDKDSGA